MRLAAVVLNLVVLVMVGVPLATRGHWGDITVGGWVFFALMSGCSIVNLIVLRETVKAWVLRFAQKRAEEGGGPRW
jgi:hypothetical protein